MAQETAKTPAKRKPRPKGAKRRNKRGHFASFKADPAARAQVEAMAGYGVPEAMIAKLIRWRDGTVGVDTKTLRKHFRSELDLGMTKANTAVIRSLFQKATGDGKQSVAAAIWWSKARLGWRERPTQITGAGDGPIETRDTSMLELGRRIAFILAQADNATPR